MIFSWGNRVCFLGIDAINQNVTYHTADSKTKLASEQFSIFGQSKKLNPYIEQKRGTALISHPNEFSHALMIHFLSQMPQLFLLFLTFLP